MPEEFGRYRLLELIGRGGMGEVYRALDTVRERTVALKLLPDYLAGDESFETRFRRESRMAARLNEPHIIPIHDFGEIDGRLFIDMRLVEGRDLGSLLETRGTLPVEMAVDVIAQAASALDAAHAGGLVHRDVKPSNILLTGIDQDPNAVPFAYLVDFGIARASSGEGTALTATTTTVGTVAYMAPERISGQPGDLRADVYALACVLYETLAGRKPFEGEMFAQMYAHMNTPPPHAAASRPEIPASLDAVIATGMAKAPADRYGSAGALAAAARTALRESAREDTVRRGSISGPVAPAGPAGPVGPAGPAGPGGPAAPVGPVAPGRSWTPPPPGVSSPGSIGSRPPSAPPRGRNLTGPPPGAPGTGPHDRPPSLHPPLAGGGHGGSSRRNAVLVAVTVIVLALAAVVGVVAYRGHDNTAAPGPTASPTRGSTGASSGFPPSDEPTLRTGEAGTPAVSWAHFAAFSGLVGTRDTDTDHSFDGNTCTLSAATTSDARSGAVDEVQCVSHISTATITVARFGTGDQVQSYLHDRLDTDDYHQLVWTSAGLPRGITIVTPRSGTGPGVIITSMCGLPNYLVQISSPDRTKLTTLQLYNKFWIMATFPDVTPPECDATYVAAKAGAKAEASVGPAKDVLPMTSDVIRTLVQRGDTSLTVVQVGVKGGTDVLGVGQRGSVSFYTEEADTLTLAGTSTYPYSPSGLGAPGAAATGSVLTGMKDATFVVRGTFSGDGSGNAVAYTNGSKGWGAIKARPDGTLAPSGQGVGISGLGLSADFGLVDGRLQTVDCSKALPTSECSGNNRVIKYWSWRKTYFTQTGSAGRSR